jgi:hypothetical protein
LVTHLKHHPELIDVDEPASGDLKNPKRRGVIPDGEYPKLDILLQSLKGFNRGLLFCYLRVVETL